MSDERGGEKVGEEEKVTVCVCVCVMEVVVVVAGWGVAGTLGSP